VKRDVEVLVSKRVMADAKNKKQQELYFAEADPETDKEYMLSNRIRDQT